MRTFNLLLWVVLIGFNGYGQTTKYTISGQIKDASTGEDLPFTTISVKGSQSIGAVSNEYGFYSITLDAGECTLLYQNIGYQVFEHNIALNKDTVLTIELESTSQLLGKAVVSVKRENRNITSNEGSVTTIEMKDVKQISVFGGEPDILKIIQLNPGVKQAGEGNSGFYVRGGGLDQNLILLDEAPVYNPSHLLGFLSVFNGDAIKGATLYKGGIPSEYGGRTSSVLDIQMRDGNKKKFGASGGIGVLSTRLTLEGPIVKDKGSFIVSGRRTYADVLLNAMNLEGFENNTLYFYDLNVKANYRLNEKNKVYLSGYFGRDVMGFGENFGLNWGNSTFTLRWNHLFSKKLFSNTSLIYSNYDYQFSFGTGENFMGTTSIIEDINLQQDFSYYLNDHNTLKFGFNVISHNLEPGNVSAGANTGITTTDAEPKQAIEGALYAQNQMKLGQRLKLNYGLRYSFFNQTGPGSAYVFDNDGDLRDTKVFDGTQSMQYYGGLEPRLSVNYRLASNASVKLGYNRINQYLHLLTNATASSPTDLWVMSSNNVKPQIADQISLGYFRNFKNNMYETSAEVYYKDMQNVLDYRNGADPFLNDLYEGELVSGTGEAYGLELQIKKTKGKLTGWVGYTLSRTFRTIEEINNGEAFPARQDRIHDISVVALYKLTDKLTLSGNFVYYTGDAVTYPTGRYVVNNSIVPLYSERNSDRMPDYHRLDLGLTWDRKKTEKFESSWNVSLYNVYGRENAFSIDFRPTTDDPMKTEAVQTSLFRWVPSITYNFKF
ncbi:MAG: TonB-dependent receptor [Bacteroidia bacterium]|nr:TonB-dependent receptor [Bacteroidia bacterium]